MCQASAGQCSNIECVTSTMRCSAAMLIVSGKKAGRICAWHASELALHMPCQRARSPVCHVESAKGLCALYEYCQKGNTHASEVQYVRTNVACHSQTCIPNKTDASDAGMQHSLVRHSCADVSLLLCSQCISDVQHALPTVLYTGSSQNTSHSNPPHAVARVALDA